MVVAAVAIDGGVAGAAGVVMKYVFYLSVLLFWAANAQAGSFWDNLWHNADQQGERLMQKGEVAAAVQTFNDPRHKAYAELLAGDYANAAKHFSAFDDSDADYNRGNALAQAGQLKEALKAYDAALAHDPNDKDARHNRDLVAKALQQLPPQNKSLPDKDSSSKDGKNGDKNQSGQSGQSDNKNGSKQNDAKNNSDKQDSSGKNQASKQQQDKSGQGIEGNKDEQQAGQSQQQSSRDKQASANNQSNMPAQNNQAQANDAEQAKLDAAAALGKALADNAKTPSDAPVSEQQLALDQWLRAIPDDPGGLLRRKFMIEHMIRQQGGQQ